jgi:hypothetical protein
MIRRKKIVTINAIRIIVWKNVTFNLTLYLMEVGKSTAHFFQRKMSCEQIPLTMYDCIPKMQLYA